MQVYFKTRQETTLRRVRGANITVEISITYSERVSVALDIEHAMRMPPTVICGLPGSTIFLANGKIFDKNVLYEHKTCFDFLRNYYSKKN